MEEEKAKLSLTKKQWGILICLACMFFLAPTFTAVSSTYALYPDYFGITAADVSWVTSITSPTACIACLFVGAFVGTRLSYRACTILATTLFTVFGGLPFLWQSMPWEMLLFCRAIFGLGVGCFNPLVQAVLMQLFKSTTVRAGVIGIFNIVFSIGNTTASMITGALSLTGSWQNAYAFYLLCIIPLVLAIIVVRDKDILGDKRTNDAEARGDAADAAKSHTFGEAIKGVPGVVWIILIIAVFATIINRTFFAYAGIAMAQSGADTLMVGTVFSVFTLTGIVISAVNVGFWKLLRMYNLPLAFCFLALGHFFNILAYNMGSTPLFFAASATLGIGLCLAFLTLPVALSALVPATSLTLCIALQEVARNLGGFLNAPWVVFVGGTFGDSPLTQFTASMIMAIAVAVVAFIVVTKINKRFKDVEMKKH